MASQMFNIALRDLLNGTLDLDTDTIKCGLLMTNQNVDGATAKDTDNFTALSSGCTMDVFDGANYHSQTLSITVSVDDTNNRGVVTETTGSTTFAAIQAGTRKIEGALIYKYSSVWGACEPIAWIAFSESFAANGGDVKIDWSSAGIVYLA